jgi:uncharacterized membrane protein
MEIFTVARIIHVLAIVIWIGGVAMVTMVIIPAVKRMKSNETRMETFEKIEGRFAGIAKITTVLSAITGFYMIDYLNAWNRYLDPKFWWIHAMTIIWLLFTIVLFVLEPFVLHKLFKKYAIENPKKTFSIMHKAHWILLILSLITIIGGVAGSHGWYIFP